MFANERKQLKDCKFVGDSRSSIASSTSSTSRIFLQAIEDTFPSRASKSAPLMSSPNEPEIDKMEFQRQRKLIDKHLGSVGSTPFPDNHKEQTMNGSDDFEAKFTALELHLKKELAKKTDKYDRDLAAFNNLIAQHVSVDKLIVKKLEDSNNQMKTQIAALEGDNKKLKERIDFLLNNKNQSLEFAKMCLEMKKEVHEFKTKTNKELEELRGIVGISKAMEEMKLS